MVWKVKSGFWKYWGPRDGQLNCTGFLEANACKQLSNGKFDLFTVICQLATHACCFPSDNYFMSKAGF